MPHDEPARQREVDGLAPPGYRAAELDRIAAAAADLIGTPIGLVTLIDRDRLTAPGWHGIAFDGLARTQSVCSHGILTPDELLCVPDLRADARFAGLRIAQGANPLRFYAGAPLVTPGGRAFGMLCVFDNAPRPRPDADRCEALRRLAAAAVARMERAAAA